MSVIDKVRFLVYRVHEKGLEVFLLDSDKNTGAYEVPELMLGTDSNKEELIDLEPIKNEKGEILKAVAIEGDWHDLPSIRKMFFKDVDLLKTKIKSILNIDSGKFINVRDVVGKVISSESSFIDELKEIVAEKNTTKNI